MSDNANGAEQRATLNQVLWRELQALRPDFFTDGKFEPTAFNAQNPDEAGTDPQFQDNLRDLYQIIGRLGEGGNREEPPLAALCLSGGGIRSATFNLGVLQALAKYKLLGNFDYLSSVSGGGYIASWLQAWLHRGIGSTNEGKPDTQDVIDELGGNGGRRVNPLVPEPRPIDHLREFSNYLTPKLGLFSADTWTAAAIFVRNLLLNWLVILPVLAALIAVPQVMYLFVQTTLNPPLSRTLLYISIAAELLASLSVYYHRRFVRNTSTRPIRYLIGCVIPVLAAAALLSVTGLGFAHDQALDVSGAYCSDSNRPLLWFSLLWCMVIPLIGWAIVELPYRLVGTKPPGNKYTWLFELIALLLSGTAVALLFAAAIRGMLLPLYEHPGLYVIFALPALLGLYLLARTLFVGVASVGESVLTSDSPALLSDGDREWWARLSGWILAIAIYWMAITGLCVFGQFLIASGIDSVKAWVATSVATAGGVSGLVAAWLGSRDKTTFSSEKPSTMQRVGLATAAPLFVVCTVLVISWGTATLGSWIVATDGPVSASLFANPMSRQPGLAHTGLRWFWALPFCLFAAALFMGLIVNINRFSLHGFYRNRLVRAYPGASNTEREADPFTGFDPSDNLRMHELQTAASESQRLLPVINVTLNLMRGERLAWQERKAESFSITPYYCGNFHAGYRKSELYGGPGGISLGTAVAISGAAANPHMGYCSSPALAFVMSLFNMRLGAWLGNTNANGDSSFQLSGPRQALKPMLGELFGYSSPNRKYVNLSDGGHFDNLGLYEVVLRRCRYILVSDAGCDPDSKLGDLGNAIRKVRIDFGISIEFEREIEIYPNSNSTRGLYCATAQINYGDVDKGTPPGQLVYIKPTLRGRGDYPIPYDVYSYSRTVDAFPHESTADQWFSESQFESYHALGFHSLQQILGGTAPRDFAEFFTRVGAYINPAGKRSWFKPEPGPAQH